MSNVILMLAEVLVESKGCVSGCLLDLSLENSVWNMFELNYKLCVLHELAVSLPSVCCQLAVCWLSVCCQFTVCWLSVC